MSLFKTCILMICLLGTSVNQGFSKEKRYIESDLIEVTRLDSTIKTDIRYGTKRNFTGKPVYENTKAYLQRPVAKSLVGVNNKLKQYGYSLLILDAYRPWEVTRFFWEAFPQYRLFLANPHLGSVHNRGCAIDVTLFDLKTKTEASMPSPFDEFSERASFNYSGGTKEERKRRQLLREIMESEGFKGIDSEWWHFDYKFWYIYPVLNLTFSEIAKKLEKT